MYAFSKIAQRGKQLPPARFRRSAPRSETTAARIAAVVIITAFLFFVNVWRGAHEAILIVMAAQRLSRCPIVQNPIKRVCTGFVLNGAQNYEAILLPEA
jgi:hypothetical protein